jgi:hypothetical protein
MLLFGEPQTIRFFRLNFAANWPVFAATSVGANRRRMLQ